MINDAPFQKNKITGDYEFQNKIIRFSDAKKKIGKYYKDGELVYEGHFKKYTPHGDGKLFNSFGIFFEGKFKDGNQHGKGKTLYPNMNVSMEGTWKNGHKNGKFTLFHSNGNIDRITKFENDYEIPCPTGTIRNPKTGNCVKAPAVHRKKSKSSQTTSSEYIKNPLTGFYEKGNISVEKTGKNEGFIRISGDKYYSGSLRNFKPNGFGTFFSNGHAHYVGHHKDGTNHGKGKYLRPDGSISMEGTWKDGKLNGKVKFITENGQVKIVPFKDDTIIECPDGKVMNYKTGNCVKSKNKSSSIQHSTPKNDMLYDKIVNSFCKKPLHQPDWYMLNMNGNLLECLLFIVENSSVIHIPELDDTSLADENKIQIILDKIRLFYMATMGTEEKKQMQKRLKKGIDGINLRDIGAFAEMFQVWIFFYDEETETRDGRWILPPKTFYNYTPKQVFFISFSAEGNDKDLHVFHNCQPRKIPSSIQSPLFFNFDILRQKYVHLDMMYPSQKKKKLNEIYNKITDTLERMPSIRPIAPQTTDEKALIQHLKHFRVSLHNSDSMSYQLFQWLKPFCEQHRCWIYLYHNKKTEFVASTMDEPFQKIFFVYKHSDFDAPMGNWVENEFQICCRQGRSTNEHIQTFMRECPTLAKKTVLSAPAKKPRKKTTAFHKLSKKFKSLRRRRN
jgi:antitoxin component YwqK of YwqJK toxin-antitoxin module